MSWGELLRIALRYTLAFGRGHLSVFMASVSMIGLVLATALLLTVLSVMNGFEREMRERILALVPHITIHTPPDGGREAGIETPTLPSSRALTAGAPSPALTAWCCAARTRHRSAVSGSQELPAPLAERLSLAAFGWRGGSDSAASVVSSWAIPLPRALAWRRARRLPSWCPRAGATGTRRSAPERLAVEAVVDTGTELDEALALVPWILAPSSPAGLAVSAAGA
jgi:lipoprotein-releasing system permease protein